MKLHAPFVQLPLQFDAGRLAEEVAAFAAAWRPHARLPAFSTLPLTCAGESFDGGAASAPMRATGHLGRCPYLMQVLAHLDAPWGRVRLLKFTDCTGTTRHADVSYYGMDHMTLHVPITTPPGMRFVNGGVEIRMEAGECWVVDTWREHRLVSDGRGEGIHLVADTVGGRKFRDLFGRARVQRQVTPDWRPQFLVPSGNPVRLRFESTGVPQVMTPWELRERIGLLLGDTRPHPKLPAVRDALARFTDAWHVLWTRYGLDVRGRGAYKGALENIVQDMELEATELRLGNRVAFLQALRGIVLETALSGDEEPAA
ncbi:MAG: aspartyl/asparaginyl beta-hydroxylase domain-containing protein [Rhodanobacteraceae bacterium]